jgi:hypothetical protein
MVFCLEFGYGFLVRDDFVWNFYGFWMVWEMEFRFKGLLLGVRVLGILYEGLLITMMSLL